MFKNLNSINMLTIIIKNVNDFVQVNNTSSTINEYITYYENR